MGVETGEQSCLGRQDLELIIIQAVVFNLGKGGRGSDSEEQRNVFHLRKIMITVFLD